MSTPANLTLDSRTSKRTSLRKEDFPKVRFWFRREWLDSSEKKNQVGDGTRGRAQVARGLNVKMRYVEDEDGEPVDGNRAAAIRAIVRSFWITLKGPLPSTWGLASAEIKEAYFEHMSTCHELNLCDQNWKAGQIATDYYPSWHNSKDSKEQGEATTGLKRARSDTSVSHHFLVSKSPLTLFLSVAMLGIQNKILRAWILLLRFWPILQASTRLNLLWQAQFYSLWRG